MEAAFEGVKNDKPQPKRFVRSFVPDYSGGGSSGTAGGGGGAAAAKEEEEIDPFDLLEPVNILSKITSEWFDNIVKCA